MVENCMLCRKTKAKRCQQIMGDLPPERTEPAAPFEYTTVDLFGPYQVKDDVKKRVSLKVWGVVFCCMASRAIHTDLVNAQSTESFLLAYQRFTALRGHPRKIWSDPGTNFVGANNEFLGFHFHDMFRRVEQCFCRALLDVSAVLCFISLCSLMKVKCCQ